jgi:hypothetical protein
MTLFRLQYVLQPTAPFGLPDGSKIVLPAGPQQISSPVIHMKSGAISSHGTLPKYRDDSARLQGRFGEGVPALTLLDNFAVLSVDADSPQNAFELGQATVERVCQSMSVQTGQRFSATLQFIEDEKENVSIPSPPTVLSLGTTTTYNLQELHEQFGRAFAWATRADDRATKALLYTESAFVLNDFAQSHGPLSRQASFLRGLAFLQLFKALGVILGEKGKDRDYQRRFRELGLPPEFWTDRVEPLYRVRNDEDVAHYSLEPPDVARFAADFGKALAVLREALGAHLGRENGESSAPDA